MIRKHIYFSGRVQGVGFRYRCYHIAHQLGLTGWTRNLYDGRVEVEIQGLEEEIDEFIIRLQKQPFIEITNYEVDDLPTRIENSFEIVG